MVLRSQRVVKRRKCFIRLKHRSMRFAMSVGERVARDDGLVRAVRWDHRPGSHAGDDGPKEALLSKAFGQNGITVLAFQEGRSLRDVSTCPAVAMMRRGRPSASASR